MADEGGDDSRGDDLIDNIVMVTDTEGGIMVTDTGSIVESSIVASDRMHREKEGEAAHLAAMENARRGKKEEAARLAATEVQVIVRVLSVERMKVGGRARGSIPFHSASAIDVFVVEVIVGGLWWWCHILISLSLSFARRRSAARPPRPRRGSRWRRRRRRRR